MKTKTVTVLSANGGKSKGFMAQAENGYTWLNLEGHEMTLEGYLGAQVAPVSIDAIQGDEITDEFLEEVDCFNICDETIKNCEELAQHAEDRMQYLSEAHGVIWE